MNGIVSNEKINQYVKEVVLKKLPDAIEESIYVHEKFPLIIDPTEQASRFLKYQSGTFINYGDPIQATIPALNRGLVASMHYGRTLTIKFETLENLNKSTPFLKESFPEEILSKSKFYMDDVWQSVLKPALGDPDPIEANISSLFS